MGCGRLMACGGASLERWERKICRGWRSGSLTDAVGSVPAPWGLGRPGPPSTSHRERRETKPEGYRNEV